MFSLYQKIAGILAIFVMILLALPFSLFSGREANVRFGIVISIVFGFTFWLIDQILASLFDAGILGPAIAAFGANVIFTCLAIGLIRLKVK